MLLKAEAGSGLRCAVTRPDSAADSIRLRTIRCDFGSEIVPLPKRRLWIDGSA